jgi:hypothetical protein
MKRVLLAAAIAMAAGWAVAQELTLDSPETAGISGFRVLWDTPVVLAEDGVTAAGDQAEAADNPAKGQTAPWDPARREHGAKPADLSFDAIHRSLLVRFPGAAEAIAAEAAKGLAVRKAEIVLPFEDTEFCPPGSLSGLLPAGYEYRLNWGVDARWRKDPPQWHAVAWALRKPWKADAALGPTFNAYVAGAGYWAKFGAADTNEDRFATTFGPAEVSYKVTNGVLDVTATLTDPAYGRTLAERLRRFADCGFLVRKQETYDHRYFEGAYEWATATGGRAIRIRKPLLRLSFEKAAAAAALGEALAPAADVAALAAALRADGKGGKPTAVMPTAAEVDALAKRHALARQPWMPDWQWQRIQELVALSGQKTDEPFWWMFIPDYLRGRLGAKAQDPAATYDLWIDLMNNRQFRGWNGFEAGPLFQTWFMYREAMPAPVQDHWRGFWTAWLLPESDWRQLDHPQSMQIWTKGRYPYYEKTGDWRGNQSFYRAGYTRHMSTMNFNHTSALGALLGGGIIGSARAMEDGRYGWEHFPLRLWSWYDGTTQESVDHYYLAVSLSAEKILADFGPTPVDRMMGLSTMTKTVDELFSCYHPALRRFICTSCRTSLEYPLITQDGLQYITHTLSRAGAVTDAGQKTGPAGLPILGHETAPSFVARAATVAPYAPDWAANTVDGKPLPFELTATFKQWGSHREVPLWKRVWLGRHYGMASFDIAAARIPFMAMWHREDRPAASARDLGALFAVYGANEPRFMNDAPGWIKSWGSQFVLQHRGTAIVVHSPWDLSKEKGIRSLESAVALYNFQEPAPTWELWVDGAKAGPLPLKARAGRWIAIRDGVTFVGLLPLPGTDLGRRDEVVLDTVTDTNTRQNLSGPIPAALVAHSYNRQADAPLGEGTDWAAVDRAYAGFVVEVADATEYKSFDAFRTHLAKAALETRFDADSNLLHVAYRGGGDTLELGAYTTYRNEGKSPTAFAYRRVNGAWPYLARGVERDTTLALQSTAGRLEKSGAVLTVDAGTMAYLQTEPASGTYAGWNPFPDTTYFTLAAPGGVEVTPDGRVGLLHVTVQAAAAKVRVQYAPQADQTGEDMARALAVAGMKTKPAVELNGLAVGADALREAEVGGRKVWLVPLLDAAKAPADDTVARLARVVEARGKAAGKRTDELAVLDYDQGEHYLLGLPRTGVYEFQRQWPGAAVFRARLVDEGCAVAADGTLALLRLVVSAKENRVEADYPLYMQEGLEGRAQALVLTGFKSAPTVLLNGVEAKAEAVELNGAPAFVAPLFGAEPAAVKEGLPARLQAAEAKLPAKP